MAQANGRQFDFPAERPGSTMVRRSRVPGAASAPIPGVTTTPPAPSPVATAAGAAAAAAALTRLPSSSSFSSTSMDRVFLSLPVRLWLRIAGVVGAGLACILLYKYRARLGVLVSNSPVQALFYLQDLDREVAARYAVLHKYAFYQELEARRKALYEQGHTRVEAVLSTVFDRLEVLAAENAQLRSQVAALERRSQEQSCTPLPSCSPTPLSSASNHALPDTAASSSSPSASSHPAIGASDDGRGLGL